MGPQNNLSRENCHRCGMKGYWKNECQASKHFLGLIKNLSKERGMKVGPLLMSKWSHIWLSKMMMRQDLYKKYEDNVEANLVLKDKWFWWPWWYHLFESWKLLWRTKLNLDQFIVKINNVVLLCYLSLVIMFSFMLFLFFKKQYLSFIVRLWEFTFFIMYFYFEDNKISPIFNWIQDE